MSRLDRINRVVASVVGLVLVAAGAYGLARSVGALGDNQIDAPVLDDGLRRLVADNAGWFWGIATFVALVVAWLGWRWLRLQLVSASPPLRQVQVADGEGGRTSLEARAVADAVARDLQAGPGVVGARVRVHGQQRTPALDLRADVAAGTPPADVRRHVDEFIVPRARAALERDDLSVTVRLRLGDPGTRTLE
ncbi:MAG: alkaline shock response membrane anchor protein AmaP [Acidimicrobiales bacterium]